MAEGSRARAFCTLLKNLLLAAAVYALIFAIISLVSDPSVVPKGKLGIPALLDKAGPTELIKTTKAGLQVKFASSSKTVTINPHANVFNRPVSAVKIKDDYMGPRPHVDTEADASASTGDSSHAAGHSCATRPRRSGDPRPERDGRRG